MTNKKSFILYADQREHFEDLPDKACKELILAIFDYPEVKKMSPLVKASFISIKNQLKRDFDKWEKEVNLRSEAGKKGMASRWHNKHITKDKSVIPTITNITDNDNDNDNDINNNQELEMFLERMGNKGKVEKGVAYTLKGNSWEKVNNIGAYLAKVNTSKPINTFSEPKVTAQEVLARLEEQKRRAGL